MYVGMCVFILVLICITCVCRWLMFMHFPMFAQLVTYTTCAPSSFGYMFAFKATVLYLISSQANLFKLLLYCSPNLRRSLKALGVPFYIRNAVLHLDLKMLTGKATTEAYSISPLENHDDVFTIPPDNSSQ